MTVITGTVVTLSTAVGMSEVERHTSKETTATEGK